MNTLKFRIAAKTDVGLVRQNNEDNFQASSDLNNFPMRWVNNEICSLSEKGALLVVADGMGGMNAGEVASEIAIETVKEFFLPENITDEVVKSRYTIEKFMNSAIEEADARIKKEAKNNPESRGMGTTIVIGWIFDNKLYVSWCGDSRAYIYNPKAGLHQISKDHSYVQSLVDKGAITKEDAFDYPDSNIITRCLSDSSTKAKPESLLSPYEICNDDIIILCTDGLSGMIRDNEIENIIRNNEHDMDFCTDALIQAACDAEGSDNITICVAQILQGFKECDPTVFIPYDKRSSGPSKKQSGTDTVISNPPQPNVFYKKVLMGLAASLIICGVAFSIWKYCKNNQVSPIEKKSDSITNNKPALTFSIPDVNGNVLTIERTEGLPMLGDKASPDGKFTMEGDTIIEVSNGKIISITKASKASSANSEEPVPTKKTDSGNKKNKIFDKIGTGKDVATPPVSDNGDEEILTPVKPNPNPNGTKLEITIHKVQQKETLYSISRRYNVTEEYIRKNNKGINFDPLQLGTELRIPIIRVK